MSVLSSSKQKATSVRTAVFPLFFHLLHGVERVVLFIDFTRPMRFPLGWINEAILRRIVSSPYGRRLRRRFAEWYALRGIRADA
jgi:hypothetical protein